MKTNVLRRMRQVMDEYNWTPAQRRRYARQWIQSVRQLGDNWRGLANQMRRS